jgi:hypothetical protein
MNYYEIHIEIKGYPAILLRRADFVEVGGMDTAEDMYLCGKVEKAKIPSFAVGWKSDDERIRSEVLWAIPNVIAVYKSMERTMSEIPIGTWCHDFQLIWRSRDYYAIEDRDR